GPAVKLCCRRLVNLAANLDAEWPSVTGAAGHKILRVGVFGVLVMKHVNEKNIDQSTNRLRVNGIIPASCLNGGLSFGDLQTYLLLLGQEDSKFHAERYFLALFWLDMEDLVELCRDVEGFWNEGRRLGSEGYAGIVAIQLDGDYTTEEIDWTLVVRPEVISVEKFQLLKYGSWDRITRLISPKGRVLRLKHGYIPDHQELAEHDHNPLSTVPYSLFPEWHRGMERCVPLQHLSIDYGGQLLIPSKYYTIRTTERDWIATFASPNLRTVFLNHAYDEDKLGDNLTEGGPFWTGATAYWERTADGWALVHEDITALRRDRVEDVFYDEDDLL
ncbi:hypothetical protein BDR04DRAFT_1123584, partial [Suillus decipiens]